MSSELKNLAKHAVHCLLANELLLITHPVNWKRNGFPLPIKRMEPGHDGATRQEYRPLAILEYVHEVLSGELAKRLAKAKKPKKEQA